MIVQPRTQRNKPLARIDDEQREGEQAPEWIKSIFGTGKVPEEDRETIKVIYGALGEVWLECEVIQPNSAKGRTVDVYIPREQVRAVLKECRRAAAAQRETPMS